MALLANKAVAIAKVEATPGTMEAITNTDFDICLHDLAISPLVESDGDLKCATGDHTEMEDIIGAQAYEATFRVKLTAQTAGTDPKMAKLLKGAGATVTDYLTTGTGFTPRAANDRQSISLWIAFTQQGASPSALVLKLAGAMANCIVMAEGVGKTIWGNFTYRGKFNSTADVATASTLVALTSPDTAVPYRHINNTVVVDGTTKLVSAWALDFGNDIMAEYNSADASGFNLFHIATRKPRYSCNPLKVLKATDDTLVKFHGHDAGLINMITTDTIPLEINVADGQIISVADAKREGLEAWDLNYKCRRNGQIGSLIYDDVDNTVEDTWEILMGTKA